MGIINSIDAKLESFFAKNKKAHPNRVSTYGTIGTVFTLGLMYYEFTRPVAPLIFGLSVYADSLDGRIARKFDKSTKEGAKIDPLMDKIKNLLIGSYMIGMEYSTNPGLVISNISNFVVDGVSQLKRGPVAVQAKEVYNGIIHPDKCEKDEDVRSKIRANSFGKAKTVLQSIVHGSYITTVSLGDWFANLVGINPEQLENYVKDGCAILLTASAVLGAIGIYKRTNPK